MDKRYETAEGLLLIFGFLTWVALVVLILVGAFAITGNGPPLTATLGIAIFGCFGVLIAITLARAQIETAKNTVRMVSLLDMLVEAGRK